MCSTTLGRRAHLPAPGQLRRPRDPTLRGDVRGARPRDHRRVAEGLLDHRGRRGEVPRRCVPRSLRDAREPGRADPAVHHRAHRHHRGHAAARSADRAGPAPAPGVPRQRRDRGTQHPLRHLVPGRGAHRPRVRTAPPPSGRHHRPRPPPRARRGPGPQALDARASPAGVGRAVPSGIRRRRGDRRGAPRAARTRRHLRRPRARRPARAARHPIAPVREQAPAHRPPAARPGCT